MCQIPGVIGLVILKHIRCHVGETNFCKSFARLIFRVSGITPCPLRFKTVEVFCPLTCQCSSANLGSGCPKPFGYACDRLSSQNCLTLNDQHYCPGMARVWDLKGNWTHFGQFWLCMLKSCSFWMNVYHLAVRIYSNIGTDSVHIHADPRLWLGGLPVGRDCCCT